MTGLAVRLLRVLAAAIHASVWLASILTLLVYAATTFSQADPDAGQATSILPEVSSLDGENYADVEPPFITQGQASGSEPLIPGLSPESLTVAMFWDKLANQWSQSSGLSHGVAGYSDGEIVPSLLQVGGLTPGTVYQVWLDYAGCSAPQSLGFDFLGASPGGDAAPDLITSGPGRSQPDARIPIPTGASQAQGTGVFDLWGGTFLAAPRGPFPSLSCPQNKLVILRVLAHSDTIFLLWGSHIAEGGQDLDVISRDHNPAPTNAAAGRVTLSPVTAMVRPEQQGTSQPIGQD